MANYGRDLEIGIPGNVVLEDAHNEFAGEEFIVGAIETLKTTTIVSCPVLPIGIPGIGLTAEDASDAMGTLVNLRVPKRGVIVSATYFDLDDEGTQVDLEIFNHVITQVADNATWTCSDADIIYFLTEIAFVSFDDHTVSQTSEVTNIGKAYTAPEGLLWIQAVCRVICTIAADSAPRFQLQIQSFDPDFKES